MLYAMKWYQALTINYTSVPAAVTDMTVVLTAANFSTPFKTLSGAQAPQSTGSDVRFFSDATLDTQIPFDIIDFSLNATPANSVIEIDVKVASVSNTVNTIIYVAWGDTTLSLLAKSNTYGGYNAYKSGFQIWCPMKDDPDTSHVLDRTSNARSGTKVGAANPAQGTTSPYINEYEAFINANGSLIDFPTFNTGNQFIVFVPFSYTGAAGVHGFQRIMSNKTTWNAATGFEINLQSNNDQQIQINGSSGTQWIPSIFTNISTDGWETFAIRFNGANADTFVNTTKTSGTSVITSVANNSNTITIGDNAAHNEMHLDAKVDNVIIYVGTLSDGEIQAMQNNQRAPATFITAGTTHSVGPYWSDNYIISHRRRHLQR
jgi:hypothetical protein